MLHYRSSARGSKLDEPLCATGSTVHGQAFSVCQGVALLRPATQRPGASEVQRRCYRSPWMRNVQSVIDIREGRCVRHHTQSDSAYLLAAPKPSIHLEPAGYVYCSGGSRYRLSAASCAALKAFSMTCWAVLLLLVSMTGSFAVRCCSMAPPAVSAVNSPSMPCPA